MSSIVQECPTFTLDGLTAMSRGTRVLPDGNGDLQPATNVQDAIGTLATDVLVGESHAAVDLFNPSRYMIAGGAIAAFAGYGPAVDGKIVTGGTDGLTLQAATADGDMIICVPFS